MVSRALPSPVILSKSIQKIKPLITDFMAEFNINFMLSSLLYAGSTIVFLAGTLLVERLGFNHQSTWTLFPEFLSAKQPQKVIVYSPSQARLLLSSCLHGIFFVMMGSKGGYWVSFCAYMLSAFARAILTAVLNAYFSSGSKQSLGYAFGLVSGVSVELHLLSPVRPSSLWAFLGPISI